tara:strand:+ start:3021 stop:3350 length:330 start_codon:yes stop_codon:yes gene_type:complete
MDLNEYQLKARKTALYPNVGDNIIYPTLGLAGEAGEVAEKVKKVIRDRKGKFTESDKDSIKKELGDVLWYIAQLGSEIGFDLNSIAEANLQKLSSRFDRGVIGGSGDER